MKRTWKLGAVMTAVMVMGGVSVAHAEYPEKSVRLVVPFNPGGGTDTLSRLVAKRLGDGIGQPVVVDNKGGAASMIGTRIVATSEPDGYTMLAGASGHSINPSMYKDPGYDATKDFVCLTHATNQHIVLAVPANSPVNTMEEFIAYAKENPGKLSYGSSSFATGLPMQLLMALTDIDMTDIPYKGSSPVMTDLIAGRLDATFGALATIKPFIDSGQVKALALGDNKRSKVLPDLPTVAEQGVPEFQAALFNGFFVPTGTPQEAIDRLTKEFAVMYTEDDFVKSVTDAGFEVVGTDAATCEDTVKRDLEKWTMVAKRAGIVPQ